MVYYYFGYEDFTNCYNDNSSGTFVGGPGEVHVTCVRTYLRLLQVALNIEK